MQKYLEGLCNSELGKAQFLKILNISEVSSHKNKCCFQLQYKLDVNYSS